MSLSSFQQFVLVLICTLLCSAYSDASARKISAQEYRQEKVKRTQEKNDRNWLCSHVKKRDQGDEEQTLVLLVAVEKYPDFPSMNLKGPINDLKLIVRALEYRGVPADSITQLENPDIDSVRQQLCSLYQTAGRGDTVFLYWGGHAPQLDSGQAVLLASDVSFTDGGMADVAQGVKAQEFNRYTAELRNLGVFVVVAMDVNSAYQFTPRQKDWEPVWSQSSSIDYEASQIRSSAISPRAGGFAAFMSGYKQFSPEMKLPHGSENAKTYGLFSWAFASALMQAEVEVYADVPQLIQDTYSRLRWKASSPVSEITDPQMEVMKPLDSESKTQYIELLGAASKPSQRGASRVYVSSTKISRVINARLTRMEGLVAALVNGKEVKVGKDGMIVSEVELNPGQKNVDVIAVYDDIGVQRLSVKLENEGDGRAPGGKKYAFIVANQNYESSFWTDLETPKADARALEEMLREQFGFSSTLQTQDGTHELILIDATKNEILSTLSVLRKHLTPEDSLIVFYAGHGQQIGDHGYWIPMEGTEEDYTWVSAFDVTQQLKRTASRHILLISDSCYAGALLRSGSAALEKRDVRGDALDKYAARTSRMILASGGEEPVSDGGGEGHSVFADALLKAFAAEAVESSGFTVHELFPLVQELTAGRSEQIPMYSPLRNSGHEGGALVFKTSGVQ